MKKIFKLSIGVILFATTVAHARSWKTVTIPGTHCGNGSAYKVFVDIKNINKNLYIELMPGGACWSSSTCYGGDIKTWLFPIPVLKSFSNFSSDNAKEVSHPFINDSAIYFPYCTGDVYAGNHTAKYGLTKVHHEGYANIVKTFAYLKEKNIIPFDQLERLTIYGASAGAIGALIHMPMIETYVPAETKKYALIDSPGLHFGDHFWEKFTPALIKDYSAALSAAGVVNPTESGFIAPKMGPVFEKLSNWQITIFQSTMDHIMSKMFGDISEEEHKARVLSSQGIAAIAAPYANVKTWITDNGEHMLLIKKKKFGLKDSNGITAIDLVKDIFKGQSFTSPLEFATSSQEREDLF